MIILESISRVGISQRVHFNIWLMLILHIAKMPFIEFVALSLLTAYEICFKQ
jgi:hypothetical protein